MVDGAASLMTAFHGMIASGLATHERGANHLDTGAHFYNVYECADGRWISIAPIEGKFYAELLRRLDIDPATMPPQMDRAHWPEAQAVGGLVQDPDARRMVRGARRHRRLLCPGFDDGRGGAASAQQNAPDLYRDRRDHAAGAGAPFQPHRSRSADPAAAAASPRQVGSCAGGDRWSRRKSRNCTPPALSAEPPRPSSGGGGLHLVVGVADLSRPSSCPGPVRRFPTSPDG